MSREHQRYSPTNQARAIARYAEQNGLEIVATYRDEGRSGLTLKSRDGLRHLLADVLGGKATFKAVLVLDVSRWGRFQDPDQGAHYEWACREAGVQVRYCAEAFENDGSSSATLLKHIKRVMAAEYSRELGRKVFTGQANLARLGFKQGGTAPYGLRRQLVDATGKPLRILGQREWKSLQTDRVVLVHGPADELDTVRVIFRWFAKDHLSMRAIVDRLASERRTLQGGAPITQPQVQRMLRNAIYRGVYTYNRTTQRMQMGNRKNPREDWIQTTMLEPIVDARLFASAQRRLDERRRPPRYSDEALLSHLRRVAESVPRFKGTDLDRVRGPCAGTYYNRFGTLERALELCGWAGAWRRRKRDPEGRMPSDEIVRRLRHLLREKGHLSRALVEADPALPSASMIQRRFGGLLNAYKAAGWKVGLNETRLQANRRRWRAGGGAAGRVCDH